MNLNDMRVNVEIDLKDAGNARWSDAELNRAIARVMGEYSAAAPRVVYVDKVIAAGRWFDLSAQAGYLWCEAVEYPVDDEEGPLYRLFRENRDARKVYVLGDKPVEGETARFWYARTHTLDAATSTIPVEHEELIALGAAAFAALSWANYAIDRVNVSGLTPQQYRDWAEPRLQEFRRRLEGLRGSQVSGIGSAVPRWGESV